MTTEASGVMVNMDELRAHLDVLVQEAVVRHLAHLSQARDQIPAKRSNFTQADVARAVKGATAGGMKVGRAEIETDGRIVVYRAGSAPKRDTSWDNL